MAASVKVFKRFWVEAARIVIEMLAGRWTEQPRIWGWLALMGGVR